MTTDPNGGREVEGPVVKLNVRTKSNNRAISPKIYGIDAIYGDCDNPDAAVGLCRLGGNPYSTYNWENNASNAGNLGCFENNDALGESDEPAAPLLELLKVTERRNAAALLTVPILPYVAADKLGGSAAPACSGDVRKTKSFLTERFKESRALKGASLAETPDATDDSVSQDEFVAFVKNHSGDAPVLFSLDNQPELWSITHEAVHPEATSYEEVVERNVEYAKMIRETYPDAQILGFGGYGYLAFKTLQDAPNRPDEDFLDYYLSGLKAASDAADTRLIDYLDLHWYPEVNADNTRIIEQQTSPAIAQARLQATRSLWDPAYVEESWITDPNGFNAGAIQLIPWVQEKIDRLYPGTQLSISEWSYGGQNDISGALAVADVLGVFGREGVGLASLSLTQPDYDFALGGLALYRNYDGEGGHFGDTAVSASSNDVEAVTVYASTDSESGKLIVIAINRSDVPRSALVDVQGATFNDAQLFELTDASPLPQSIGDSSFSNGKLSIGLRAYSALVIAAEPE